MSPSEIGFLALGLGFGVAAGASLLAVMRPYSPLRPVVKVTITPNALGPREGSGGRPGVGRADQPILGSPDEEARLDLSSGGPAGVRATPQPTQGPTPDRTRVPSGPAGIPASAIAIPVLGEARAAPGPAPTSRAGVAVAEPRVRPAEVAAPVELPDRVDVGPSQPGLQVRTRPVAPGPASPSLAEGYVAVPVVAARASGGGRTAGTPGSATPAADPCADDRTRAASACSAADAARDAARAVADQLRDAQRAHADLQARVEEAGALADPRRLAAEKERLHAQFRAAHSGTASPDEAEAAARDWLTAVSAANSASRDAARRVQTGTEELRSQAASLEKLELEANAARISAERAEDQCRSARESLAACEERQRATAAPPEAAPGPDDASWPGGPEPTLDRGPAEPVDLEPLPVILRVLRGDAAARERLVASLAGDDASETAAWHVRIAKFVDAVTACAIEDGYLEVAEDNPFWRLFSADEQREIVLALSALGFRFDGLGGFTDDRAPSARDLSLAVGYAGLDRMRIRTWPGEAGLAALFDGASVRADLWLARQADDLALARVEAALGPRAAGLSDLWDAWGRARPAMLEEG